MNVLSLFDGISCGKIALDKAGIKVDKYVAYEIDKSAIKVSEYNYPEIIHKGDVFNAVYDDADFDLLIGGSPCSWWSNARASRKDIERKPSGIGYDLFMEYVRALREVKPKYFLYENNYSISQEIKDAITKELGGVEPIMINSSLVSAQSRKRCYWTNIPNVKQPIDKNIKLSDVIPNAISGAAFRNQKQKDGTLKAMTNIRKDNKSNCLLSYMSNKNCCVQMKDGTIRPLTAEEFEILQTIPKGYTKILSETKRKSVIGLGWTVDVIAHILKDLNDKKD